MNEDEVLQGFYQDPLPPSEVDIARAIRTGRHHRRVRTATTAAGVAVLLLVAAAATPHWRQVLPSPGSVGPVDTFTCSSPDPRPVQPPLPDAPPTEFDPLSRRLAVDAPSGLHVQNYLTARYWQQVILANAAGATVGDVELFASDSMPAFASQPGRLPMPLEPQDLVSTDPVDGHPAYWLPGRQSVSGYEGVRLAWQWSPGAWVFAAANDTSTFDEQLPKPAEQILALRGQARQIAEALTVGPGTPVSAPFTVRVPDCTQLISTGTYRGTKTDGTPFVMVRFAFGQQDPLNPLMAAPEGEIFTVSADSGLTLSDKPSVDTMIDGHPVQQVDRGTIMIFGVYGFAVGIHAPGDDSLAFEISRTVHIVPNAGDESSWTTEPLTR